MTRLTALALRRRPAASRGLRPLAAACAAGAVAVGAVSDWGAAPLPVVVLLAAVVAGVIIGLNAVLLVLLL